MLSRRWKRIGQVGAAWIRIANPRMAPSEAGVKRRSSSTSTVQACTPVGSKDERGLVLGSANRYRFEITTQFVAEFGQVF